MKTYAGKSMEEYCRYLCKEKEWEEYKADKYKYIQKKALIQELKLFFQNLKERTLSRSESICKLVDK